MGVIRGCFSCSCGCDGQYGRVYLEEYVSERVGECPGYRAKESEKGLREATDKGLEVKSDVDVDSSRLERRM